MAWYMDNSCDNDIIISSRVRLARNLNKYPFCAKIDKEKSKQLIEDVKSAIINDRNSLNSALQFKYLEEHEDVLNQSLVERHMISPMFLNRKAPKALISSKDESIAVMINEEDHIRIQSIKAGSEINEAYDLAFKLDNLIEETVEYAYDYELGYKTSCITNLGTGLRASYMVHLPMLSLTGQIKNIIIAVSKLGITVRGIYGEGTEATGNIYQVSNQVTIGQTEEEMIANLKNVLNQIIEKEKRLRDKVISENKFYLEDKIYRSYGILKNSRIITSKEAMACLSDVRLGYNMHILNEQKPKKSIYNIMIDIQPASMTIITKKDDRAERDIVRADYIRNIFTRSDENAR